MPSESHPEAPEKFYLTTPIYYVNARPHIGHAYSTIVADVLARRHRLLGHDTYFLTGTDEHGQKIERSAAAAGVPPQQFADQVSKTFSDLWQRMGITNDDFIRTTDPRHKQGVQLLFQTLYDQGHIYLSTYTGQYSIGEEMFVEGPPGTIGPDGRPTETVTEENFFFRLSAFQRPLLDLIESGTLKITPESSRNEVLSFLRGNLISATGMMPVGDFGVLEQGLNFAEINEGLSRGQLDRSAAGLLYVPGALKDLSVSRSSFTWGIPVPEAVQQHAGTTQPHVIYVWLDALANYMTSIGYGSNEEPDQQKFHKYWPANLHLVGREITRFHCIYWPAFLIAAGLPIPEAVAANGWLLFDNAKMSKSKGNVIRTETVLDAFGEDVYRKQFPDSTTQEKDLFASDIVRYFLLAEIPFGEDGDFSFENLILRYNADLANGYGNLVSRTLSMIARYDDGTIPLSIRSVETPPQRGLNLLLGPQAGETRLLPTGRGTEKVSRFISPTSLLEESFSTYFDRSQFMYSIENVWTAIGMLDAYITAKAPWKQGPDDVGISERRDVLYTAAETIRIVTALLYPIIPNATAKVWSQLGLGSIESAAANGELKNLQWGGLKPGTKLGPLSPIFPRADKSLATRMEDLEAAANPSKEKTPAMLATEPTPDTSQQPAAPETHPANPLKADQPDPRVAEPSTTDPAAPPRTSSFTTENPGAQVAASHAITTEREGTPPHTEAQASGIFAAQHDTPQIGIDDFTKIDLRVAKILVAERIPKADKLLRLEVDLGYEQRQILSGIAEHYTPEELIGRKIVIIANLAPRTMRKLVSHGMLLAASDGENGKPILATFGEDIAVGTRLR